MFNLDEGLTFTKFCEIINNEFYDLNYLKGFLHSQKNVKLIGRQSVASSRSPYSRTERKVEPLTRETAATTHFSQKEETLSQRDSLRSSHSAIRHLRNSSVKQNQEKLDLQNPQLQHSSILSSPKMDGTHPYYTLGGTRGRYPRFPPRQLISGMKERPTASTKMTDDDHSRSHISVSRNSQRHLDGGDSGIFKTMSTRFTTAVSELEAELPPPYPSYSCTANCTCQPKDYFGKPSERFLGLCYPGRCEAKKVYDCKLNMKLFPNPADADRVNHCPAHCTCRTIPSRAPQSRESSTDSKYRNLARVKSPELNSSLQRLSHSKPVLDKVLLKQLADRAFSISLLRKEVANLVPKAVLKLKNPIETLFNVLKAKARSNFITKEEFFLFMKRTGVTADTETCNNTYKLLDADKDGLLSLSDFKKNLNYSSFKREDLESGFTKLAPGPNSYEEFSSDFKHEFGSLMGLFKRLASNVETIRKLVTKSPHSASLLSRYELKSIIEQAAEVNYLPSEDTVFIVDRLI